MKTFPEQSIEVQRRIEKQMYSEFSKNKIMIGVIAVDQIMELQNKFRRVNPRL